MRSRLQMAAADGFIRAHGNIDRAREHANLVAVLMMWQQQNFARFQSARCDDDGGRVRHDVARGRGFTHAFKWIGFGNENAFDVVAPFHQNFGGVPQFVFGERKDFGSAFLHAFGKTIAQPAVAALQVFDGNPTFGGFQFGAVVVGQNHSPKKSFQAA